MNKLKESGIFYKRVLFAFILVIILILTLFAAYRYAIPMEGIPDPQVKRMDSGWYYENGDRLSPLEQLPCNLSYEDDRLYMVHDLTDEELQKSDVLAMQTRYQSIRVWADDRLIYEAAQGKEFALSSMWHFVPAEKYLDASKLRVELVKYDGNSDWQLFSVLQDHPDAILMYLLKTHLPIILVWICCMLFTLLLLFIIVLMAIRRIEGIRIVLSLASFIFLSGTWILLDSKVTTVNGGNFALTYFFSYCVFYLLPVPLLFYFLIMRKTKNRVLRYLIWISAANTGIWMLMHILGIVSIQKTAWTVHLVIITFLIVFLKDFLRKDVRYEEKRPFCTFWGILLIFAIALASILMYHMNLLPPTNSAVLYVWGLLTLILCMTVDTVMIFERIWREKQSIEIYRQLATKDSMSRLANRNAYELRMRELVAHPPAEVCFIIFDIDRMKKINDTYGHHVGDQVIFLVAGCLEDIFGDCGDCYRIGGDEFCVILTSSTDVSLKLREFDGLVASRNKNDFPVSVSYGWEQRKFEREKIVTLNDIIELKTNSDKKLYLNKKSGRRN